MGDLVIGHGEGAGAEGVEDLAEGAIAYLEQAGLAQYAVEGDRLADIAVAVFADDPDAGAGGLCGIEQRGGGVIELADESGHVGAGDAGALGLVIEVGQVGEQQVGAIVPQDIGGGLGDPAGAGQAGAGTPEGGEREGAEVLLQPGGDGAGQAVDAEAFVAIGAVEGLGCDADVERGALVEPPEEVGGFQAGFSGLENLGQRGGLDQVVGLLPETDFPGFAEEPAVGDDAVVLGEFAGDQGGLGGAGDGGGGFDMADGPLGLGQGVQTGGMGQQAAGEADGAEEDQWGGHGAYSVTAALGRWVS